MDQNALSVSQFLDILNSALSFTSDEIFIEGEITGFQKHPTGFYFSLKDSQDSSVLACYMSPRTKTESQLGDGILVRIRGRANIYKPKGKLSLIVSEIKTAGEGALKKQYDLLKQKLENEGLFDRKRELPENIKSIGLITSKTGAVISDFRNNLNKLGFEISFFDSRVEGAQAIKEILTGIEYFNNLKAKPDILVIIRGGGSLEDLQAFNNENIARAIFSSKIPTICAIGHDKDVPLAQLVADFAPSTPTAVAIAINQSWSKTLDKISGATSLLVNIAKDRILHYELKIQNAKAIFANAIFNIQRKGQTAKARLNESISNLNLKIRDYSNIISLFKLRLSNSDPRKIIARGFAIVKDSNGKVITDFARLSVNTKIQIINLKSTVLATVDSLLESGYNKGND